MNQLIEALDPRGMEKSPRDKYMAQLSRYTAVKEEHAELVKREVRIIWGDFFKADNRPDGLHDLVDGIMKSASAVRQNVDLAAAEKLLGEVNEFAEAFWAAKNAKTKKAATNPRAGGG